MRAQLAAAKVPQLATEIKKFWFYDLREGGGRHLGRSQRLGGQRFARSREREDHPAALPAARQDRRPDEVDHPEGGKAKAAGALAEGDSVLRLSDGGTPDHVHDQRHRKPE